MDLITNPLRRPEWEEHTAEELYDTAGALLVFAFNWDGDEGSLEESVLDSYGYPEEPCSGFTVEDYVLLYPEDDPLYPTVKATQHGEDMYVYRHAFVYFPKSGNVYRMD